MEPGVESEGFLERERIEACRFARYEHKVPAVLGHGTRDCHETMPLKEVITESLLASAWNARAQPIRIGYGRGIDDMHFGPIDGDDCREYVGNRVERTKALMDGNLEDCCRGIDGPAATAMAHLRVTCRIQHDNCRLAFQGTRTVLSPAEYAALRRPWTWPRDPEAPCIVRDNATALATGMCFPNEPMIVFPGVFGVRREDDIQNLPLRSKAREEVAEIADAFGNQPT